MVRLSRSHASRPDPEVEKLSAGSGPVKSSFMSPEELEDYRARTGYKVPKDQDGKLISPPVQQKQKFVNSDLSSEAQSRRAQARYKNKEVPDKEAFLKSIAAGNSIAATERAMGLKANGIYHWLKKWGLTGIKPDKARELLGVIEQPEERAAQNVSLAKYEKDLAEWDSLKQELQHQRNRIIDYESELARWVQIDNEKDLLLSELQEDVAHWMMVANQRKDEIEELDVFLREAKQAIRELEDEREMLLATIEEAAVSEAKANNDPNSTYQALVELGELRPVKERDNVNSPAHYTQGGIETIEFIRAKLTPEEFVGYCKGNVLKYVSRATHKGGHEDLRKAGKYIEFAVRSGPCTDREQ